MATGQVNRIVDHLRWLAHGSQERARSDAQLLERFISVRDDNAFEELVRRHGAMVLGVCRRLLGHAQDAEDAFQATFMVLVRRARTVVPRELVGNWLYGVAYRVALDAQARAQRRRAREKQVEDMPHPTTLPANHAALELRPVLDRELNRLPEKYRVAIVLCDLEGRSRKEAARQLGVPEGTLSSRLAAGRKLLAARLAHHGVLLSGASLAMTLANGTAEAAVPTALAISTVKAAALGAAAQAVAVGALSARAAALTEGVMKTMLISKLKSITGILLAIALVTTGAGVMTLTADESHAGPGGGLHAVVLQDGELLKLNGSSSPMFGDLDGDGLLVQELAQPPGKPRKVLVLEVEDPDAPADDIEIHRRWLRAHAQLLAQQSKKKGSEKEDDDRAVLEWLAQLELQRPAPKEPPATDLLAVLHNNPKFSRYCVTCHHPKTPAHDVLRRRIDVWIRDHLAGGLKDDDQIIIIRIPKKGSPTADAEFLRRVCLDVLGRPATPLELRYFLDDTDPRKHEKVIEKLLRGQERPENIQRTVVAPTKLPDRAARAEAYVKEKLGKKQLTAEEIQLVQRVLEFAAKDREQPKANTPQDALRQWLEPKSVGPPK
jgi:RNA polymerase sigma factor (sigma-70 family)